MRMQGAWRGAVAALALAGLLATACGLEKPQAVRGEDDLSAEEDLDTLDEHSVLDMLEPEEREAVARAGLTGLAHDGQPTGPFASEARRQSKEEGRLYTAGKVGISVLGVALSAAAVAAPFFLF
jgi:hypothetical protein